MEQSTLEERVTTLEKTVAKIIAESNRPKVEKNWQNAVGLLKDDPIARAVDEEGRKIRQADRQQSRS